MYCEPVSLFWFSFLFFLLFTGLAFGALLGLFCRKLDRTDVELAGRDVYRNDAYFHGLTHTYAASRSLANNALGLFVVFPMVGPQSVHSDKPFDAELFALHEYAEAGQAGNDTVELLADFFAEHLQCQYGRQLPFGILGPLLGEGYVFAGLGQVLLLFFGDRLVLQIKF